MSFMLVRLRLSVRDYTPDFRFFKSAGGFSGPRSTSAVGHMETPLFFPATHRSGVDTTDEQLQRLRRLYFTKTAGRSLCLVKTSLGRWIHGVSPGRLTDVEDGMDSSVIRQNTRIIALLYRYEMARIDNCCFCAL